MKVKEFPQVNVRIAENQDEYETLPAYRDKSGRVICCFELSEEEKKLVEKTGEIWIDILTFNNPLQPIHPHIESPFINENDKSHE